MHPSSSGTRRSAPIRFAAVILDWDNTLHDSAASHLEALQQVLAGEGLSVDEARYRLAYTTDYRALYRRLGLAPGRIDAASRRWRALLADAKPRLLPRVGEALMRLSVANVPLALVTSGARETVLSQLIRLGVADRFVTCVYGDGQPGRPDPAPLRGALAGLGDAGREPSSVAYCSDTIDDMRMGVAAGVHAVGIASFAHDERSLREAGAAETAPSVDAWLDTWLPRAGRTRP